MLSEVSNYFEDPVSHNMSVRQGSMQRRRGAASGGPRTRLESAEHQHADHTGQGGIRDGGTYNLEEDILVGTAEIPRAGILPAGEVVLTILMIVMMG